MKSYTESEIIQGIEQHRSEVLEYVYKEYFPYVENYVVQHGGSSDQARDIFQDGMIVLYKKVCSGEFKLFCKLSTYLFAVCKRIWIQENRKNTIHRNHQAELKQTAEPMLIYGDKSDDEIREIIERNLDSLSPSCQKILKLLFNGYKNNEIRELMGYDVVTQVVDKKYRCKKLLVQRIKSDPSYKKYNHGENK